MLTSQEKLNLKIDENIYEMYKNIYVLTKDRLIGKRRGRFSLLTSDNYKICTYDGIYVPSYPCGEHYNEDENISEAEYKNIDGILLVVNREKRGIIDYDGNLVVPIKYKEINFYSNDTIELL